MPRTKIELNDGENGWSRKVRHLSNGPNNDREAGKEIHIQWTVSLKILRLAFLKRQKAPKMRLCWREGKAVEMRFKSVGFMSQRRDFGFYSKPLEGCDVIF